jgi:2-C-methyl-D-erythritol 2,4-cyclodiphosphate synthase
MRIGIGHDTHRLGDGGPLLIGGIEIPYDRHLIGHSDADVLLHAVTDALLGAAALGDIGELFPNDALENRDRSSAEMLQIAYAQVRQRSYKLLNLDCIIFAQRPKMSEYKPAIQKRIAEILQVQPEQIGIKAKTGENVGPIGREEIIAAECIALLKET